MTFSILTNCESKKVMLFYQTKNSYEAINLSNKNNFLFDISDYLEDYRAIKEGNICV